MIRIMVVEDQAHIRRILAMWIKRQGYEVIEAANGVEALEQLRTQNIDLLITDVNMPEVDGIELTRRAFDECLALKQVFVVTSRCDQHDIISQFDQERVKIFAKPFSPSQLLREVEAAVGPPSAVASAEQREVQ